MLSRCPIVQSDLIPVACRKLEAAPNCGPRRIRSGIVRPTGLMVARIRHVKVMSHGTQSNVGTTMVRPQLTRRATLSETLR